MMIVMYHCWPLFAAETPGKIALFFRENGGNWGNYMFFMISGFLMSAHYKESIAGAVAVAVFFTMSWFVGFETLSNDSRYALVLLICPVILMICIKLSAASAILGNKVMTNLGKLSTSLFFWHIPVYQVVYFVLYRKGYFLNGADNRLRWAAFMLLLMACSFACYLLFERIPAHFRKKKQMMLQNDQA